MRRTIRNKLVHNPETAQAVGQASHARRQAYNLAVEHCLAHPNAPYNQVQALLTKRRKSEPERWDHSRVAIQRPGLLQGYNAVKAFHKADAAVLRECVREVRYREKTSSTAGKARPPRHGNRPERDPDSQRLFLKRRPETRVPAGGRSRGNQSHPGPERQNCQSYHRLRHDPETEPSQCRRTPTSGQ